MSELPHIEADKVVKKSQSQSFDDYDFVTWNNAPNYALSPTSTAYAPTNPTAYTNGM